MALERVQKILAKAGIASRRKAEELISAGEVTINGKVAQLGDKAEWGKDAVKIKGKLLQYGDTPQTPVYLAFYKPRGVISMLVDPEGRPTLADYLGKMPTRVFPIGRLDFNSEGLILLTNDGTMAEKIQKSDEIVRVYQVKIKGHPDPAALRQLEKGAKVEFKMIRPHSIRIVDEMASKSKVEIALVGSGAMDVKGYFELKGFLTERITRTAIGNITLRGLEPGMFKALKPSQVEALIEQPELGIKAIEAAMARDKFHSEEKEDSSEEKRARREPISERSSERGSVRERGNDRKRGFEGGSERKFGRSSQRGFGRRSEGDSERSFGRRSERGSERGFGRRSERDSERSFGRSSERGFGSKPKREFEGGSERKFGRSSERSFGARSERSFGRDSGGGFGSRPKRGFQRDSGKNFGEGAGSPKIVTRDEPGFAERPKPSFSRGRPPRRTERGDYGKREGGSGFGGPRRDKPAFGKKRFGENQWGEKKSITIRPSDEPRDPRPTRRRTIPGKRTFK